MDWLHNPQIWISLATLTLLEIVLGVDNIIFISILVARLPAQMRQRARTVGLGLAMGMRIGLLLSLAWIMRLTHPLFTIPVVMRDVSGRDLILIVGGLFLLWKSVHEIHGSLEGEQATRESQMPATFASTLAQIAVLDIVFSLDSVITAVGLAEHIGVMIAAVVLAVFVMLFAAGAIGDFVDQHPTLKMLALSFLILVGVSLLADGMGFHIPKGYIYFSMAFAVGVEMLNLRAMHKAKVRASQLPPEPVHLRKRDPG
jgi:predicted tellurium resistance membrane protein TerC